MTTPSQGVLTYPEPFRVRLPEPSKGRLALRGTHVTLAFAGALSAVAGRAVVGRKSAVSTGAAFKSAFDNLGGTFVKLGQIVASAPGMFGDDVSALFRSCLDTGPPVSFEAITAGLENDLGRPVEELFRWIDPEPVGRASLAVVHRACTHDGRDVAVKILRPDIEQAIGTDLALMLPLFKKLADTVGLEIASSLDAALDGLREQLEEELDLRNELRTIEHHRQVLGLLDAPTIVIPEPLEHLSGRRTLTMAYLHGVAIDDEAGVRAIDVDPEPLARDVLRYWFASVLRDGTFHADLHAGNLLALEAGGLGVIDWGIVGRLDADTHMFFRQAVAAMLGDTDVWDDMVVSLERIYGPVLGESLGASGDDLRDMLRAVFEPFFTQPFSTFTLATLVQQMPQAGTMSQREKRRSLRELLASWSHNRNIRRMGAESGIPEMPFNRGIMMLVKQLLYFDRYGHLFLGDSALLDDEKYFAAVLEEPPLVSRTA
jgi:aarF domain-containing kinase